MTDTHDSEVSEPTMFSTSTEGLPECQPPEVIELDAADEVQLDIGAVSKVVRGASVRMLAYSGSIPGPTLKVRQGSRVVVHVTNNGDHEDTVHWHGLRLNNRFDGTHETQAPIPVGGSFSYELEFPDPGVYWYHPHVREDYGQELGLYGNILVVPSDANYWPPVHREVLLTLDDLLIEDGKVAPFSRSETNYVAMGRFGNVLLVGGEQELSMTATRSEVVRLYLTNTANTRVFNVGINGATMKLVGADSGHYERDELVEGVVLAPSERAVVDVNFDQPGKAKLEHRTPEKTHTLATIIVSSEVTAPPLEPPFDALHTNDDMVAERERIAPYLDAAPDKTLVFDAEMDMGVPEGAVVYICPMHPEIVRTEEGHCPECAMKLIATAISYACPMHPEVVSDAPGHCPQCGMKLLPSHMLTAAGTETEHGGHEHGHDHADSGGIEWDDDMVEVNRITTPANMRWKLVDRDTGDENGAIDWRFRVGDQVKIRLVNTLDSDHPMHHPFHVHGAGRFLILARDDKVESNLAWKDTVLVRTGETVDILLDVTNPGLWMAHCHIAEHHESGMMFSFRVDGA